MIQRRSLESPDPFDNSLPDSRGQQRIRHLSEARLLLVEGDATARRHTRAVLSALGLQRIIEAEDGLAALAMLQNRHLDVVLAAQESPGLSGVSLAKALKNDARLRHVPVLLMVTTATGALVQQAAEAGVREVLVKPYQPAVMARKLNQVLSLPTAEAPS